MVKEYQSNFMCFDYVCFPVLDHKYFQWRSPLSLSLSLGLDLNLNLGNLAVIVCKISRCILVLCVPKYINSIYVADQDELNFKLWKLNMSECE